jgi:hypothetical protein
MARRVVVRFEGEDIYGEGFLFERTLDATKRGDNPRFYGQQAEDAITAAASSIRDSVEAVYGHPPVDAP